MASICRVSTGSQSEHGRSARALTVYGRHAATSTAASAVHSLTSQSGLEPVFISENAGWARDFFDSQGKFSQEYFVYFKKI